MAWYFSNARNQARLQNAIASWQGTPFAANQCRKGEGVDCVQFVEAVLVEAGAMQPLVWPEYLCHSKGTGMLDLLINTLDAIPELTKLYVGGVPLNKSQDLEVDVRSTMPGDLLLCSSGKAFHHLAIVEGWPTAWHSIEHGASIAKDGRRTRGGVQEVNMAQPSLAGLLRSVYRPTVLPG